LNRPKSKSNLGDSISHNHSTSFVHTTGINKALKNNIKELRGHSKSYDERKLNSSRIGNQSYLVIEKANSPDAFKKFIHRTKDYRNKLDNEKEIRENKPGSGRIFTGKPTIFDEFNLKTSHQVQMRKNKSNEKLFSIKSLEKPISAETINPFLNASELFNLEDLDDNHLYLNKESPLNKLDYDLNNFINSESQSNLNLVKPSTGTGDSKVINYNFMNNNFYCASNNQINNDKNKNLNAITCYINKNNKLEDEKLGKENIISGFLNQIKANQNQAKSIRKNILKQQEENFKNINKTKLNNAGIKDSTSSLSKNCSTNITPLDMLYKPSDIRSNKNAISYKKSFLPNEYSSKRMDKYLSSRNNNNQIQSDNFPNTKDIIIDEKEKKVIIEFHDAIKILHKDLISLDI
jgi:hypothetical protein